MHAGLKHQSVHKLGLLSAVGTIESEACWIEFFHHMVARGLRVPTTVTSDGAPGLINAIDVVFDRSVRMRCWFHRLANIRAQLADDTAPEVMAEIRAIRDGPTLDAAKVQADRVINRYRRELPAAITCLKDDLEALPAVHRIPVRHRVNVRTTNLTERSFVEKRRRTKVIPRLLDEKSAMDFVFATLIRTAERWSGIAVSDLERHQLALLRQELGIDPPPTHDSSKDAPTEQTNAA